MGSTNAKEAAAQAVRAAEWIEGQSWPDTGIDVLVSAGGYGTSRAWVSVETVDEDTFHQVRRSIGGPWRKDSDIIGVEFVREVDDELEVRVRPPRGTCQRVKVGTKTVDVFETRCPDSFLADDVAVPA